MCSGLFHSIMHIIRWPLREKVSAYVIQSRSNAVFKLGCPLGVWKQKVISETQENSSQLLSFSLYFSPPPLLQHCPSTCSSVGSGSFVEKTICDFSYQGQGAWEPAIPELGGKKTQTNKQELCIKSLKTANLNKWSRSHRLLKASDPTTKGISLHSSNSSCSTRWPSSLYNLGFIIFYKAL